MANAGRNKSLQSIISLCLLAILCLIAIAVLIKQSDADMSRFGIEISEEQAPLAPNGFETLSEIKTYTAENLYEKINGKAPLYTESGFKQLSTQRFISSTDPNLWAELYIFDMGQAKNAFSVYSTQIRAEARFLPEFEFTYKTANALYFVHGRYYVELVGSSEAAELSSATAEIGRRVRTNLPIDADSKIPELAIFPKENLVPGGTKLYLASTFGCEGLTNTFSARYMLEDNEVIAFLSKKTNSSQAQAVAQTYYKFLIDNGGEDKIPKDQSLQAKVLDFYGTTEIVFATGRFVGGIHEAENQQSAELLAKTLLNTLNKIAE
ncbi:MAG: DUF6599 family protein [Planctomycetota bacterium]|jgi:hypothetical protein